MNRFGLAKRLEEVPAVTQTENIPADDQDLTLDVREFLQLIWRQKKFILAIIALILLLAGVILSSLTPRYTASSLVEINPRQTQVVNFDSVLTGLSGDSETIQTEIKIIESRRIARRTIERLHLNRDPEFNPALRPLGLITTWRKSLADWLTEIAGGRPADTETGTTGDTTADTTADTTVDPTGDTTADATADTKEPVSFVDGALLSFAAMLNPIKTTEVADEARATEEIEQTIDTFLKQLTVSPERLSRVIRISFESTNPATAAAAVNTVADFYIVAQLEAKFEATKRATTWLNERVQNLREEVVAKERAIEEYRAKSGLLQGGNDTTLTSEQVSELNAQHVLELARLAEAQARLRQMNQLLKSPKGIESASEVLQSELIRDLRRSEAELERQIAELSEEYGERHPTMVNARAELRDLRHKIQLEVDRIVQGLRNEVAIAQARASSLAASLEKVKSEVAQHNEAEVDLRSLERDANAARTLLETLLQRTKQTASQESFQEADATVVSYAPEPREPSFPRNGVFMLFAFLGSLPVAVLLAFVVEKLDLGFRSAEQISRYLKVRPLGLLPRVSKLSTLGKAPHQYVLSNPESAYAEGIRTLYTNIVLTDVVKRPKVILITSTLPREGKTSVSLSLARLLGMAGHRVIIVDCDLRNPSVHRELGLAPRIGLVDCLSDGAQIEDVIEEDPNSNIHVMQAGKAMRNAPELLDSVQMQKLLRTLARKYDLIILDSAPLLAVSDTLFVSRLADKTVFLVRWAQTRRAAVTLALKQLITAQADVAGVALTMVDVKANAQYGYGDSGAYRGALKKYYTQ